MKQRRIVASLIALTAVLSLTIYSQTNPKRAGERTSVDLTIYNQNLSLIREERTFSIAKGLSRVIVPDIPATIDGTSLHFSSLTDPLAVRVLEQNYQYDLVNQAKLLEKYIGKEVEFVRFNEDTKKEYAVTGKLLAAGFQAQPVSMLSQYINSGMVAEINGKVEINPAGRLVLPSLPEGLILKPQLEWLVENTRPGEHKTEVSYLAGQLSWNANYVALLNADDTKLDLTGWVTVTNNSGTSFKGAGLKLVAGDINLVREEFNRYRPMLMDGAMAKTEEPQFKQTELFEYKLYTLQRHTDVNDNETKQVELVSGKDVTSKKVFIYDGLADQWRSWYNSYSYRNQGTFGQQSNTKVGVFVTLKNDKNSGLGIPLPKGKVRVYKRDEDKKEQFIGEDQIDHTPKDEELRLYLGNAFDIVGERAQTDFKSFASGRVVEETIQIKVRNHKETPAEVQIYEHPWRWSQWEITKSSTEWTKVDQTTIKFPVKIEKDGEKVVTYTIRYSW
ncbi:MAG: hypothetical protein HYR76_05100 [Ignavibacteria bacterium]|nr:hypothetical protein [Ignavibacteria bacterium]